MAEPLQQPHPSTATAAVGQRAGADSSDAYGWPWRGYSDQPGEMPLAGYSALLGVYLAAFGILFGSLWSRRDRDERVGVRDALLFGVATHKIGRIITKDWVTSPIRAPFTRYQKSAGGGEVEERSRDEGIQRAIGDLLTCPWCIAPWVAGTLYATFLINPPAARLVAAASTSVAVSDSLQHLYSSIKRRS